ncbi:MAG: right-handed parallel beta-helix repeat-containing protein [Candidatus Nealsonbacteria bacterium]|nr:MAG: right-handed parallel beta-helix repeat-containing protein [Candidatus Nealsonbacteria bacterium]
MSNYNTITGNNCTRNEYGICLGHYSDSNTIIENNCTDNDDSGIYLCYSNNNTITRNNCINNDYGIYDYGIYLYYSYYGTITGNTCTRNRYGIYLDYSDNNEVSNNFLIKNTVGIEDQGDNNNIHDNIYIFFPVASFDINSTVITVGQTVQFTDSTTGGSIPLTYQWNFGDGSENSTIQNPIHKYNSVGIHLVVLTVTDADGDMSVYSKEISVQDDVTNPILDSPQDVIYEEGATGYNISWIATDLNPGTYKIYKNGSEIESGTWESGMAVTINVDGLAVGSYNYTIVVTDAFDNAASDTVWVTVEDTVSPVLTSPDDVTYEEGATGYNISWIATDLNPGTYKIYKNGSEIESGTWESGMAVTINVDGLAVGSYNYTIVVTDAFGNMVSDIVWVTVEVGEVGIGIIILLISLIGAAGVAAIIIFLKRRQKH